MQQVTRLIRERGVAQGGTAEFVWTGPEGELRQTARVAQCQPCSYQMIDHVGGQAIVIETGHAIALDRNAGGVRLLMSRAPEAGQYIEIHTAPVLGRRAAYLFEVWWTKLFRLESKGGRYVAGCCRTFGPCNYFQFFLLFPDCHELSQQRHCAAAPYEVARAKVYPPPSSLFLFPLLVLWLVP
ncbi:MAG TPA: hypothetical protein VLD60_03410 [Nitrospira sp.]|nr:hypothetical protein [Nitrospira sp.]